MVVDTSLLITVLVEEPGWQAFVHVLKGAPSVIISSATYLETRIVILRRGQPEQALLKFESLLLSLGIRILPVDEPQARIAAEAYTTYRKGRHPAALDFGDCFSYALAKHLNQPLLFKGDDFRQTDVLITQPA